MKIPDRLQVIAWLATVVVSVALVSHVLDQPHDLTFAVILLGVCLLTVDWLIIRKGK